MNRDEATIPSSNLVADATPYAQGFPPSHPHDASSSPPVFTLFSNLPPELRAPIWKLALPRRIIKWTRNTGVNTFSTPKNSIFEVCKESREAAMLYGEYVNVSEPLRSFISDSCLEKPVLFSPLFDILLFEPIWTNLMPVLGAKITPDPLDSLPTQMRTVRSIMVHPHYTDERKKPAALFEKLPFLEQILVAADEKSVGSQSKFILGTVYDIRLYYAADVRKRIPEQESRSKTPFVAVGCLGWTGKERRKMNHGKQDTRELVAVFENEAQMKAHLAGVREEEWRFTQELQLKRPVLKLRFKNLEEGEGRRIEKRVEATKVDGAGMAELPSYSRGTGQAPERPPPYVETEEVMGI
ncbi:uncharacterized protein RAG0_16493 [Rhynchosporium agropyri]|uniref:2EXR domain-containing protein n=1 Tax=Rhynchosporium agropyri TaxID=914238 RepID=A0A1E1LSE8_9HELO|nr:uncharacterized protein RAG0_16493 [Rhynchosporium agropyri]